MKNLTLLLFAIFMSACTGMPDKVSPVSDFDLNKYLGKWYEIARLDHSFERGMEQVTAEYILRSDGGVTVINRGFLKEKNKWKQAEGKAYFVEGKNKGYLKVSFFGPFYGSYVVFGLDKEAYQYAFVSGPDLSYLWLLSRTPELKPGIINLFINNAKKIGFNTDQLIMVKQK